MPEITWNKWDTILAASGAFCVAMISADNGWGFLTTLGAALLVAWLYVIVKHSGPRP